MKKDITIILDRSGSMNEIKSYVISEFNRFTDEFKSSASDSRFNLIQFNDQVEQTWTNLKSDKIETLNDENYIPFGATALFDAIGQTLNKKIKFLTTKRKPRKVIIAIITDGRENSSLEYSQKVIKDLIAKCSGSLSWKILFFGANQDAVLEGDQIGIDKEFCKNIKFSRSGMLSAFQSIKGEILNFENY